MISNENKDLFIKQLVLLRMPWKMEGLLLPLPDETPHPNGMILGFSTCGFLRKYLTESDLATLHP